MALTDTPRPSLSLAMLGIMDPIVEINPDRLNAMADALLWWGEKAATLGHAAQGERYYTRACVLRDLASVYPCCGVSAKDYCQC